jgi:hypothetical protein
MSQPKPDGDRSARTTHGTEPPELFSAPRMPSTKPWLPLVLGGAGVALSFLPMQLFDSDASLWLFVAALYGVMGTAWALSTTPARRFRRSLRLRLPWKRDAWVTRTLLERWSAAGILAPEAASHADVRRFEQQYQVVLPDDLRDYFTSINGTKDGWSGRHDEHAIRFWHLHQVQTFKEEGLSEDPQADRTFVFARYWFGFASYGVRLSTDASAPTPVVARFPYGEFEVAQTFREFVIRYLLDDLSVLFPDFVVIADDNGIGAEHDGIASYAVMWSDVQEIQVVVNHSNEEESECAASWVISSCRASIPFIAPVDTVAGGNVLRTRIRALDGFDDRAFQAAREAEQRNETGSFVVWRSPDTMSS